MVGTSEGTKLIPGKLFAKDAFLIQSVFQKYLKMGTSMPDEKFKNLNCCGPKLSPFPKKANKSENFEQIIQNLS
jgi:hypothetical protein